AELRSPADAVVLKIGRASTGSVATATSNNPNADPLFTLVPLAEHLEADIDVGSPDIGFIRVGDPVQLKAHAYRYLEHGTARGVVKTISEGSFDTDENNQPRPPYFRVRIQITDTKLNDVPSNFRLIPGMTLQGDIKVGSRTILSYLVSGAMRNGSEAMR